MWSYPPTLAFSGHETFPFRYAWLKKGLDAAADDPAVFRRDEALTALGVGKNMVRSIRHWCLAAGVIEEVGGGRAAASGPPPSAAPCSLTTAGTPTSKTRPPPGSCTGRSPPTPAAAPPG